MADLVERLRFSTREGRIWLDDERMLLIHARALGSLRNEIIESVGVEAARRLFTRMGFHAGADAARLARKVRSKTSLEDLFFVGPQLHGLLGSGLAKVVRLECDVKRGGHYGEFLWTGQAEDEEHARHLPSGAEPMCWMQIGYASGFGTELLGRAVLYREVECQSMGQANCRIVGKTVAEWGPEAAQDLQFLGVEKLAGGLNASASRPIAASAATEAWSVARPTPSDGVVGASPKFNAVVDMVKRVAPTRATVLLTGESGVGKEVFARMLHRLGSRSQKPFVAVNCAAIPEALIESELFGAERGAYTGATHNRAGRFERADGGTLFLDEIGTMSAGAQGKLLRALQEGSIERVGDSRSRHVDVRVIAAANADLRAEMAAGRFREDLFFRLNVFPIRIPPLRERRDDIRPLMDHFLAKFAQRHGRRDLAGFTSRALDAMLSYEWPGNIRELENVLERGVILATDGQPIDAQHLFTGGERLGAGPLGVGREGSLVLADSPVSGAESEHDSDASRMSHRLTELLLGQGDGSVSLEEVESMLLKKAVERAEGNVSAAARLLGITRPQMVYRLKNLELACGGAVLATG